MKDLAQLLALLRSRRSVRAFQPQAPPAELIESILEAATTAPSASNKQPWRFFVVQDRAVIAQMSQAVADETARIAQLIPESSVASFESYGGYFTRFAEAPVVIVSIHRGARVLSHLVDDALDDSARQRVTALERDSGLVGASLALMNLLLAAHAAGLGASAMTGPLIAEHRLRQILEVPASWEIVALVPLGYPDEQPAATKRKRLSAVTRWIR